MKSRDGSEKRKLKEKISNRKRKSSGINPLLQKVGGDRRRPSINNLSS
jgi:hypothetical protein